jgi:antitoxin component YwqK of YwqJK toxin-antitoxin module
LRSEYNYKNGEIDGLFIHYYETGILKFEANYKNGKICGIVKHYDENGNGIIQMN